MSLSHRFRVNDKVEANYKIGGTYYPGKIRKQYTDALKYDVLYDDGEVEYLVLERDIRKPGKLTLSSHNLSPFSIPPFLPSSVLVYFFPQSSCFIFPSQLSLLPFLNHPSRP